MSYYTTHGLKWEPDTPDPQTIAARLAVLMGVTAPLAAAIAFEGALATWYDAEEHLVQVSSEYPGVLFTLQCTGEDDDQWTSFFKDGMTYTERPEPPTFDPAKLQARAQA